MELLGHMVCLYLTFWETAIPLSNVAASFYNPVSLRACQHLSIVVILAILVSMKYLAEALICICLI